MGVTVQVSFRVLILCVLGLLSIVAAPAVVCAEPQSPPPTATTADPDTTNEYRITAYPNYTISKNVMGFGYIGYFNKPAADYQGMYLGTGAFFRPKPAIQLWAGLITVFTDQYTKSNSIEVRPFTGIKFLGMNAKKWRYYNWSRYELRMTETRDTGDWTTVHRFRTQTRLELPLAPLARAWQPKTFYGFSDLEPIWRSDTGQLDPLRLRFGVGYIASSRLLVEFQYYAEFTNPSNAPFGYTGNMWRMNFKLGSKRGIWSLLDGGSDDY